MTISPALLVEIFQTCFEVVNIRPDAKTVIDSVLGTGLEGTGGEASLAAGTSGRLDATKRRGGGICRRHVHSCTDIARISERPVVGIVGTGSNGVGLAATAIGDGSIGDLDP